MNEEIDLKRKLIEATNNVRKKFKQIKSTNTQSELNLKNFYNPIAKPLTSISDAVKQQQEQRSQKFVTIAKRQSISKSMDPADLSFQTSTPIGENIHTSTSIGENTLLDTPKHGYNESTLYETPSPSNASSSTLASNNLNKSLLNNIVQKHITGLKEKPSQYDTVYGVRYGKYPNRKKTYVGSLEVRFKNGNISFYDSISSNVAVFDGTPKLYDLLFLKVSSVVDEKFEVNENILQDYKQILQLTNAAHQNYNKSQPLRETRWKKYLRIIQPLMMETKLGDGIKKKNTVKTNSLPKKKKLSFNYHEYVYWNKPKELVDRLRLLWSSKVAGHTGHDNEIMSIMEELREEGIIY
jgi:hypothetical protein